MSSKTNKAKIFTKSVKCMVLIPVLIGIVAASIVSGCKEDTAWNDPYIKDPTTNNIFYTAFSERPKHLDPAKSYSSNEWSIISQIYEPPMQYSYLKRPYQLESLVSDGLPSVIKADGNYSVWEIKIRPQIFYQNHPAFAQDSTGKLLYHGMSADKIAKYKTLKDFNQTATRELTAEDYVYQIKRLADPKLNSPVYGFLSKYIIGFDDFRKSLATARQEDKNKIIDLRDYPFQGAYIVDKYTYHVVIKGNYPEFKYWLAMPFFAPIPWEADLFFSQQGMEENNLSLDWYPIGTGPYMLSDNNPERRMVMIKNTNFHGEKYPSDEDESEETNVRKDINVNKDDANKDDIKKNDTKKNDTKKNDTTENNISKASGSTANKNDEKQNLPFIEKIVFVLEKEDIPYWNKFLQGYFDISGVSSDSFDSAIDTSPNGSLDLTEELKDKGISLLSSIAPTTMYWGFNMLDPVIGGTSEANTKLRQAIAIAFDVEEFISIFANGRGIVAHSPIPPEILATTLPNDVLYDVQSGATEKNHKKKSIASAKQLLKEAGYVDGRNIKTGEPLVINFEAISSGDPNEKAIFSWLTKQLAKLDIQLNVRVTDYNRFRDKMDNGGAQMFFWGWNADYPDPENFLFMFYGKNAKVGHGGENVANYVNPEFDKLFEKLGTVTDTNEKNVLITSMIKILQHDTPWIWGYHPDIFTLQHMWVKNNKPSGVARNTLKYLKIDGNLREQLRKEWNTPIYWPFFVFIILIFIVLFPAVIGYLYKEHKVNNRFKD